MLVALLVWNLHILFFPQIVLFVALVMMLFSQRHSACQKNFSV